MAIWSEEDLECTILMKNDLKTVRSIEGDIRLFFNTKNYYNDQIKSDWANEKIRAYQIVIRNSNEFYSQEEKPLKNWIIQIKKKKRNYEFNYETYLFDIIKVLPKKLLTAIDKFDEKRPMPVVLSYLFTSSPYLILGIITIPRFLILAITILFVTMFHLNQPYKHYPLQQFLIVINSFYLFIAIIPLFGIRNTWINSGILFCLLAALIVGLQFLKYTFRSKLGLWSNTMIFLEIFLETMDILDSKILIIAVHLIILSTLTLIGALMIKSQANKNQDMSVHSLKKYKKELFLEVVITAMLTLKVVAISIKSTEPFRIPSAFMNLIYLPSLYDEDQKKKLGLKSVVFILLFYFFRMVIVFYRRRPKVSQRDENLF